MSETKTNGMDIAPDVLDTIVALALNDVEGIAHVGSAPAKIFSFLSSKQDNLGVKVDQANDDAIDVSVVLTVFDGHPLNKIADDSRKAIADAILSQAGLNVNRVDIHVDGIVFQD